MKAFLSEKINRPLVKFARLVFPALFRSMQNIRRIEINPQDRKMLEGLGPDRVILCANHPTTAEPPITFYMGKLMNSYFKFMASRQVFNWNFGLVGPAIRRLGAFSVIAGIADRESLKAARRAISDPAGKLIIFPEGEPTSGENDTLMPFQPGLAQLAIWGYEDAQKSDRPSDVKIVASFMRFVIDAPADTIRSDLDKNLRKLEKKLSIDPGEKSILRRFLTLGRVLMEKLEREYGIEVATDRADDFDFRVGRVRHTILDNIADKIGIQDYDRRADAIRKFRFIFSMVELMQIGYDDPRIPVTSRKLKKWAFRECVRAFDFIAMKRDYILSLPSAERLYEWLDRFEAYLYNKTPRALGGRPSRLPRIAHVSFAPIFGVSEVYPKDRHQRKEAVGKLTERLRMEIQRLMRESEHLCKPLFTANDI